MKACLLYTSGREEKTVQMTSIQALITILAIAAGTQFTRWLPFWLLSLIHISLVSTISMS